MTALNRAAKGRTTVIIAHRLSTVVDADVIIVLEDGRVAESGSHMSLVSNHDSLYYRLWQRQHEADRKLRRQKQLQKEKEEIQGEQNSSSPDSV